MVYSTWRIALWWPHHLLERILIQKILHLQETEENKILCEIQEFQPKVDTVAKVKLSRIFVQKTTTRKPKKKLVQFTNLILSEMNSITYYTLWTVNDVTVKGHLERPEECLQVLRGPFRFLGHQLRSIVYLSLSCTAWTVKIIGSYLILYFNQEIVE